MADSDHTQFDNNDNDDFEVPLTQTQSPILKPLSQSNNQNQRPSKKPKTNKTTSFPGKENIPPFEGYDIGNSSLDFVPSTLDSDSTVFSSPVSELKKSNKRDYFSNSLESRLVASRKNAFDLEVNLCDEFGSSVDCPLCGVDISNLTEEQRNLHTNDCLDKSGEDVAPPNDDVGAQFGPKNSPVVEWIRGLGLAKYEEVFVREEVDWDTLQWLTEEDLLNMGITALGPRKKIVHALSELRRGITLGTTSSSSSEKHEDAEVEPRRTRNQKSKMQHDKSERKVDGTVKPVANKLITEYFPGFATSGKKVSAPPVERNETNTSGSSDRKRKAKNISTSTKIRDIPKWCAIQGTPFRVDAFKYLRGDCSHWFLTHFHMDHYQGLTKSFNHGKIYCSSVTARLVNMNIGIPYDKLHILPLNQKVEIAGIGVTCLDANHCPGSIIILFEPPNVLHTGDFRYSEEMANNPLLQTCPIHTLILDTTYCNPQYDFPKQEAVIQFVIDAIQAEAFNPRTLFLIGSYTIGKERLFLEVARSLHQKVYVTAAKLRLLKCLEFTEEDMQWFTSNEHESNIHVAPMWTLASFKRLKHISSQYASRFSLIVAFSPTGWTFGKGKKKSPGRRWQQGTIIRYEVPYSEHCSFTELKEFVNFVSPDNIIPSVNNDGPESADAMVSLMST
ncbi:DNA cross-link repair protein pso2/SNM1, putative [Medicago truncatula]|uniref:DNA cross-link repair protein pso2/SNM1, putative n=1 Tax=Medicago truncatula TaxID=3880 RepID=G7J953_MEDTR|nr:DNA cross-link repair protein pso2/SNM1, putative [Medicago truncatula]